MGSETRNFGEQNGNEKPFVFDDQIRMNIMEDVDQAYKSHKESMNNSEDANQTIEQMETSIFNKIDDIDKLTASEPSHSSPRQDKEMSGLNEETKKLFSPVLDEDEKIIKTYKPHKIRTYIGCGVASVFTFLMVMFFTIILSCSVQADSAENIVLYSVLVAICFMAVIVLIIAMFYNMWYNNTIYALTNKRVIIRTGHIGVDYKSLEYSTIGAVNVNVSWIDRLFKTNTGTLSFGSMSSPIVNGGNGNFNFKHLEKPYEMYREIKDIIYDQKLTKNK